MRYERGLSTIPHCLEWYKLVLRTRLSIPVVRYLVRSLVGDVKRVQSDRNTPNCQFVYLIAYISVDVTELAFQFRFSVLFGSFLSRSSYASLT